MNKKDLAIQGLIKQKLLPLYYNDSAEVSIRILHALHDAGINLVEYTSRGDNALANFKELKKEIHANMPSVLLGIGTIKNVGQAIQYINAGADFIICPSMNEGVAQVTHNAGLLWVPGCLTSTEIASAENAGASIVKIFPGNILGPSYISAIKDLFPLLKFIPTGGVDVDENNLKEWFNAGVIAVGMGSKLIGKEMVEKNDYAGITMLTKKALQLIDAIQK